MRKWLFDNTNKKHLSWQRRWSKVQERKGLKNLEFNTWGWQAWFWRSKVSQNFNKSIFFHSTFHIKSCLENSESLAWVLFVKNARQIIGKYLNKNVRGGLAVFYIRKFMKFILSFVFKTEVLDLISVKYSGKIIIKIPDNLRWSFFKIKFSRKYLTWENMRGFIDLNINRVVRKPRKYLNQKILVYL